MQNFLSQLKTMTIVVADTGELSAIQKLQPQDVTTNPTLLTTAFKKPETAEIMKRALLRAKTAGATLSSATDYLAAEMGIEVLSMIKGRVSTEVDARLSYDTEATLKKARRLIELYGQRGISKERVLIKIASTYEGIKAAEVLEKEGIHCNMTLLFSLNQAAACADAKVTLISPFVGRILDWHKKNTGVESYAPAKDPGVVSVTEIYNYYKRYGYKTEIMGASFRNLDEILELSGCDLLTIAPNFLEELATHEGILERKLSPSKSIEFQIDKIAHSLDENAFRLRHENDKMASDKLAEGIAGFVKAISELEEIIAPQLS